MKKKTDSKSGKAKSIKTMAANCFSYTKPLAGSSKPKKSR
jgi:hypothetical protein